MSIDNKIHIANDLSEPIYVLPVPNPDWVWGDIAFGAVSTVVISIATQGSGTAAAAGGLVNTIKNLWLVQKLLVVAEVASIYSNTMKWVTLGQAALREQALASLESTRTFLEANAVTVQAQSVVEVFKEGVWMPTRYLSPTGWGAAFDASNMCLFIATKDLRQSAILYTNGDFSWIVKSNEIVRARYGSLWQEDRGAGWYRFAGSDALYGSAELRPGQALTSKNRNYDLVHQADGDIVLFKRQKPAGESKVWSAKTAGKVGGVLRMQSDGNLVFYDAGGKAIGHHGKNVGNTTYENPRLVLTDSGTLRVIHGNDSVLADILQDWKTL